MRIDAIINAPGRVGTVTAGRSVATATRDLRDLAIAGYAMIPPRVAGQDPDEIRQPGGEA